MPITRRTTVLSALALASALAAAPLQAQAKDFITIGIAGQTGVYYVVGQSVCQLVSRGTKQHNLRCTAPATGGSIANLNGIAAGDLNFGVVQSDWQYHAFSGTIAPLHDGAVRYYKERGWM